EIDAGVETQVRCRELRVVDERKGRLARRDVHQPGAWIERHGLPGVGTLWPRSGFEGLASLVETRTWMRDGSARWESQAACPGDRHEVLCGDGLAGATIEHIEETVLGRLHQHLALASVDAEIGQHQLLRGIIIPDVPRGGLVMPDVLAGIRAQRQNGRDEK